MLPRVIEVSLWVDQTIAEHVLLQRNFNHSPLHQLGGLRNHEEPSGGQPGWLQCFEEECVCLQTRGWKHQQVLDQHLLQRLHVLIGHQVHGLLHCQVCQQWIDDTVHFQHSTHWPQHLDLRHSVQRQSFRFPGRGTRPDSPRKETNVWKCLEKR